MTSGNFGSEHCNMSKFLLASFQEKILYILKFIEYKKYYLRLEISILKNNITSSI